MFRQMLIAENFAPEDAKELLQNKKSKFNSNKKFLHSLVGLGSWGQPTSAEWIWGQPTSAEWI